jgi:hypothetical protein
MKKSLPGNDLVLATKNDHQSFLSEDEQDKGLHGLYNLQVSMTWCKDGEKFKISILSSPLKKVQPWQIF